LKKDISKEM